MEGNGMTMMLYAIQQVPSSTQGVGEIVWVSSLGYSSLFPHPKKRLSNINRDPRYITLTSKNTVLILPTAHAYFMHILCGCLAPSSVFDRFFQKLQAWPLRFN